MSTAGGTDISSGVSSAVGLDGGVSLCDGVMFGCICWRVSCGVLLSLVRALLRALPWVSLACSSFLSSCAHSLGEVRFPSGFSSCRGALLLYLPIAFLLVCEGGAAGSAKGTQSCWVW